MSIDYKQLKTLVKEAMFTGGAEWCRRQADA